MLSLSRVLTRTHFHTCLTHTFFTWYHRVIVYFYYSPIYTYIHLLYYIYRYMYTYFRFFLFFFSFFATILLYYPYSTKFQPPVSLCLYVFLFLSPSVALVCATRLSAHALCRYHCERRVKTIAFYSPVVRCGLPERNRLIY